ncbi:MAG: glutamine synthetase family protein [Fimbriimonadaceae bacterium]|nr:glutamine synthetase family protein [Alphaproteobacteria bacterium]
MDLEQLKAQVQSGEIDTVLLVSPDMQGRLVGKRLTARHFLKSGIDGVGTCSVVLGWGHDHALDPGYEFTGWANGYPDLVVKPDFYKIYPIGWSDRTVLVVGDNFSPNGDLVGVAPRSLLKTMIAACAERGLSPMFASELECYLLAETPESAFDKGFVNLRPKHRTLHPETLMRTSEDEAFLGPLRRHMEAAGIEIEMVKAEYAPGQIEINLGYTDAMAAADRHVILKSGVKELALQNNLVATFMAKLSHDLGGSSCHIHMSMCDKAGKNVFMSEKDPKAASDTMRHFLGGLVAHSREFFLFFAPTINSYKRLKPGTFAPATVTWGEDNRTVALRMVGRGQARRIENRIPGADVNPYLAYSAMLAAGLHGIEQKIEPAGEPATGNAYALTSQPKFPTTLEEATDAFSESKIVARYFGDVVQKHYANFGRQSIAAAAGRVTDYERQMLLLDI